MQKSFQEYYKDHFNHCYGCGQLNELGLKIKSYWYNDNTTICKFVPQKYHTAFPGFVYGGLIASVIDCHSVGSAAAVIYKTENRSMDSLPKVRFLTASLKVDYLKPTPINETMVLYGRFNEIKLHKVIVHIELQSRETICAKGQVIAVRILGDKIGK